MNIFPSSPSPYTIFFFFVLCFSMLQLLHAQQTYVNNKQLDCYNFRNDTLTNGYVCNGPQKSCTSYLTFRSQPPYNSASQISYLLGAGASAIARINNITDVETIPTDTQILVPVNCSCSGRSSASYYQHNATYILKQRSETYFTVANDTYQGLSTCQALMNQNSYGDKNLTPGLQLLVPLRCACPSTTQSATGVKFLLAYLVTWRDSISSIASTFNVDEQSILDANELSTDPIFPFTPVLVPLKAEPTKIQAATPPSPTPPPPPPIQQVPSGNSSRKWVFVGIGIGVGGLFLLAVFGFVYCFICGRGRGRGKTEKKSDSAENGQVIPGKRFEDVSSAGVRVLVDSLTVYRFEELQKATGYFGDDHVIKGRVYRGVIRGDNAAIKKLADISSTTQSEINILKQINHSSIIRLSGYCVHEEEGSTYLVYEFAENGSLYELLHNKKYGNNLVWNQRVQIAYDVADGLNYLHNYTNPPYIHKDLKSSNILLNGDFRAKMINFGLARTMENHPADEEDGGRGGGLHMTRHVVGTRGYMPPEYLENGVVTPKLDVFAFGVVMLELLSGKDAASASGLLLSASIKQVLEGENVREKLKGFMDPSLEGRYPLDSAFSMANLAKDCVEEDLNYRPTMDQVFMSLSKILSSSLDWDPSDEVEFSRSFNRSR